MMADSTSSNQEDIQPKTMTESSSSPISSVTTAAIGGIGIDKTPSWKMDLLMEKLRQKAGGLKTLTETAKNIRVALLERRNFIDQGDKVHLQKCLDQLQQSIKINSFQSMGERLEMISRQQGLKFNEAATGNEFFISSDMFYLEILVDPNGVVQEVKIQHDGKAEQQACPEITESLKEYDFQDFTSHLEGLISIYQLNADKKIKSKAFIALQALESDLYSMSSTYANFTDNEFIVMKSLLGLLQPRKGGHPICLVFYITPYDFLDVSSKTTLQIDSNTIFKRKLGVSATISIKPFTSQKLQMSTTVNILKMGDGKCVPRYGVLNATNSTALPACFSINLKQGIPICKELLNLIEKQTGIQTVDYTDGKPVLDLITEHYSKGVLDNDNGLFVTLPDQIHCYFMTKSENLDGMIVSTICFTLASQLPHVINIMRQQLVFNTLIVSCVRTGSKPDMNCIVFEVNALSYQNIAVSFQNPLEDSLVTLEFNLKDVSHPVCHLHAVTTKAIDIIPTLEEYACKVVQRSMSIPITLRAVLRRWQTFKAKYDPPNPEFNVPVGGGSGVNDSGKIDMPCGVESERQQQPHQQQQQQQIPGVVMNLVNSSTSNINISPIKSGNFQKLKPGNQSPAYTLSPIPPSTTHAPFQQPNSQMDMLNSYMNPFFQNFGAQALQNLQTTKMAIQMNLLNQMQGAQNPSQVLMNLVDQMGQRGRRKKRKGMSSDSSPSSGNSVQPGQIPRNKLSPPYKRRASDASDDGGESSGTTAQQSIGLLMSELGFDNPDPRWNIDITPVGSSGSSSSQHQQQQAQLETFNKLLSTIVPSGGVGADAFLQNAMNDPNIDTKLFPKIRRDFPKRSISLDSSQMGGSNNSNKEEGRGENVVDNFKPMLTPSLSITPVSTNSSLGSSAVNSLLANIRPGIEIIPLPNPVTIPNSITVTPILPKDSHASSKMGKDDGKKFNPAKKRKLEDQQGGGASKQLMGNFSPMKNPNRPNFALQLKKPGMMVSKPPNLKGSPIATTTLTKQHGSGGKPSVSTLKSVATLLPKDTKVKLKEKSKIVQRVMPKPLDLHQQSAGGGGIQIKVEPQQHHQQGQNVSKAGGMGLDLVKVTTPTTPNAKQPFANNPVKKGGLAAVIDKLKSQCSVEDGKKEIPMAKADYLKVSSNITSEIQKRNGAGGNGATAAGTSGTNQQGQEYMVKTNLGGGLKLTINKTKSFSKEKLKAGMKIGLAQGSIKKPPFLSGKPPISSASQQKKKIEKDGSPQELKRVQSPLTPKANEDLTKKLFMPGALRSLESGDCPKFDSNFQIPKKSRSSTPQLIVEKVEIAEISSIPAPAKEKEKEVVAVPEVMAVDEPTVAVVEEKKIVAEPKVPELSPLPVPMNLSASVSVEEPVVVAAEQAVTPEVISSPPKIIESPPKLKEKEEISPESPAPEESVYNKPTTIIPTTPRVPTPPPKNPTPPIPTSIPPSPEEDELIIDIPQENSNSNSSGTKVTVGEETVKSPGVVEMLPPPPPPPATPTEVVAPNSPPVVPIVSVHIVHSPQPNSPITLLRSPLVVAASPLASSPFPVDDDLMDEAVIGGAGN